MPSADDLCTLLMALRPGSVLAEGGVFSGVTSRLGPGPEGSTGAEGGPQLGEASAAPEEGSKVTAVCRAVRKAVQALPAAPTCSSERLTVVATSYAR